MLSQPSYHYSVAKKIRLYNFIVVNYEEGFYNLEIIQTKIKKNLTSSNPSSSILLAKLLKKLLNDVARTTLKTMRSAFIMQRKILENFL